MKLLVALSLLAFAAADVSHLFSGQPQYQQVQQVQRVQYKPIAILQQRQETSGLGDYKYSYETENGIKAEAQAVVKNAGTKDEALASEGSFSFVGDDGVTYTVNWIADESGYRAEGAHLPTPPPIPAEILRSLEINLREEQQNPQRLFA